MSHGWFDLVPFRWEAEGATLHRAVRTASGRPALIRMREAGGKRPEIRLELPASSLSGAERRDVLQQVRHMLRLDEPLEAFHDLCRRTPGYGWVPGRKAGRLLRAPAPFEDLVKLVCTTNCSWSLTRVMVSALVGHLGDPITPSGPIGGATRERRMREAPPQEPSREPALRAFPTPEAMASAPLRFFRDRMKAGYRAPHLLDLARRVARGDLDPTSWIDPRKDPAEIQEQILSIRGAGPYVAENMLKLLGRYEGLGLDSWCRRKFSEIHRRGRKASDRVIRRHYARFGTWQGLALWCDLTRDWIEAGAEAPGILRTQKY